MPTTRTASTDIIRFGDLDPQGHVNQAVFLTYFESGRVAMFRNPDLGIGVPGATFVLVRMEIDYLRELRWPGTVEIGTGVAEFGRSSFKVDAGDLPRRRLRRHRARHPGAASTWPRRKPRPLPEDAIARLSQWKYRGA